jgi:hypothetical protein
MLKSSEGGDVGVQERAELAQAILMTNNASQAASMIAGTNYLNKNDYIADLLKTLNQVSMTLI